MIEGGHQCNAPVNEATFLLSVSPSRSKNVGNPRHLRVCSVQICPFAQQKRCSPDSPLARILVFGRASLLKGPCEPHATLRSVGRADWNRTKSAPAFVGKRAVMHTAWLRLRST